MRRCERLYSSKRKLKEKTQRSSQQCFFFIYRQSNENESQRLLALIYTQESIITTWLRNSVCEFLGGNNHLIYCCELIHRDSPPNTDAQSNRNKQENQSKADGRICPYLVFLSCQYFKTWLKLIRVIILICYLTFKIINDAKTWQTSLCSIIQCVLFLALYVVG